MKKTLLLSIVALFINIGVNAQNDSLYGYYYAGGVRNYWQEDFTSANIIVGNTNHFDSIIARLGRIFNGTEDEVFADDEDNNIIVNSNRDNGQPVPHPTQHAFRIAIRLSINT